MSNIESICPKCGEDLNLDLHADGKVAVICENQKCEGYYRELSDEESESLDYSDDLDEYTEDDDEDEITGEKFTCPDCGRVFEAASVNALTGFCEECSPNH